MIPWNRFWGLPALGLVAFVAMLSQPVRAAEIDPRFDVRLLRDIGQAVNAPSSQPADFLTYKDRTYFVASDQSGRSIWTTSGTTESTRRLGIASIFSVTQLQTVANKLIATTSGEIYGAEPYNVDVQRLALDLIGDINPGTSPSIPARFCETASGYVFFADTGSLGYRLWRTTLYSSSTAVVNFPGSFSFIPQWMVGIQGRCYFQSFRYLTTGEAEIKVWVTDGTDQGTHPIYTSIQYYSGSDIGEAVLLNSRICFTVTLGPELWCAPIGGQAAAVADLSRAPPDPGISPNRGPRVLGNKLYYSTSGVDLGVTDGTTEGTRSITVREDGRSGSRISELAVSGGKLYFAASATGTWDGTQVWVTDPSSDDVSVVTMIDPNSSTEPHSLTDFNGSLVFLTRNAYGNKTIWKSNGTPQGTLTVATLQWSPSGPVNYFWPIGQSLYFAYDDGEGIEPWIWTNRPPQAVTDKFKLASDGWMTLDVLANDSDIDGALDTASIEIVDPPKFGAAEVINGAIRFKGGRVIAADYFSYRVRDTQGGVSEVTNVWLGSGNGAGAIQLAWLLLLAFACIIKYAIPVRRV